MREVCKTCKRFSACRHGRGWCLKWKRSTLKAGTCAEWVPNVTPRYETIVHHVNVTGINYD